MVQCPSNNHNIKGESMANSRLRIYFSDFFGITPEVVSDYGAFNISLINDLPLFIDPFLLFNSEKPEYRILHEEMIDYVRFLKSQSISDLPVGLIKAWFHFPEIKENWLGYSKNGNGGRGLGPTFARSLKRNLSTVFTDFGEELSSGSHLGKLTLIKNGVGRDQISDFTCNLICGFLAHYTEKFALEHISKKHLGKFNIQKVSFNKTTSSWASRQFTLPKFGNQFVLLTPTDLLTKDEAWISHQGFVEDYSTVFASVDNGQLRDQINHYFHSTLPIEATQQELSDTLEKVIERFPAVLDYYVRLREQDRLGAEDFQQKKLDEATDLFLNQASELAEHLVNAGFYDIKADTLNGAIERMIMLRDIIEGNAGATLFTAGGGPISREGDAALVFKLAWYAVSTDGPNSDDKVHRIAYDSEVSATIELKLARNKHIEKILELHKEMLATSQGYNRYPPVKAILASTRRDLIKINALITKFGLSSRKELVVIDASAHHER
jgi:hypothetical protein